MGRNFDFRRRRKGKIGEVEKRVGLGEVRNDGACGLFCRAVSWEADLSHSWESRIIGVCGIGVSGEIE